MTGQRVKVAIQKSGRLTDHSLDLLKRCGLKYSRSRDQLLCYGENMPIDALMVRDDDIPELINDGTCDFGIVGLNVAEEKRLTFNDDSSYKAESLDQLDFGHCKLMIAGPRDALYQGAGTLSGRRIATTYPGILGQYLSSNGVSAEIVEFSGAVEIAPRLGKADYICDLVSTGSTLAANQMEAYETIFESQAVLLRHQGDVDGDKKTWMERLQMRIQGVLQVKESKYIMLHAPRKNLDEITSLLPGSESPTLLPLEGLDDKVVLHAVCRENVFWETLEALKSAGASSILVLPVEKMLS